MVKSFDIRRTATLDKATNKSVKFGPSSKMPHVRDMNLDKAVTMLNFTV